MARMYPNRLSPDTKSEAERLLYAAFRDGLDDSYTVFHSVAWQSRDKEGRPRDGEADFIIAHPDRGILVLEAKGGIISRDPGLRSWISVDLGGVEHEIRDPFLQARDGRYSLEDLLIGIGVSSLRDVNIGYAVAFPDVVVGDMWLGMDKPREITMDRTDLANLSGWVGATLAYWRGQRKQGQTAPGTRAVQALVDLLGKSWELRPAMWGDFVMEQRELIRLTEQQYLVLDVLNRQRRAAVCGCAGSGKTMLAVEKATRLARQGFRVLLTCFNKKLAENLRFHLTSAPRLDVLHFHGLCYEMAKQVGTLPEAEDSRQFVSLLPEALLDATDRISTRYDAIIVDEGQDFQPDWWIPLQALLHDPEHGILYIFFDDNQRIYVSDSSFPIEGPPYALTRNCRNTQCIHHQVLQFYEGETIPNSLGPPGRPIEVVSYKGVSNLPHVLLRELRRLVTQDHVPPSEIVLLTPRGKTSQVWSIGPTTELSITDTWPPSDNQIYGSSIYAFKGLECSVAVLAEVEHCAQTHADRDRILYVACSRARNHLIVLLPDEAPREVRECFLVPAGRPA